MQLASEVGSHLPRELFNREDAFPSAAETIIKRIANSSDCVIVGRAAAVILQDRKDALHVRLDGSTAARVQQAAAALHLTEAEAQRKLQETDRARANYLKLFYQRDWTDPGLYHVMIDSTAISLEACAKIIVVAAEGRMLVEGSNVSDKKASPEFR
jgi:cytidylate kinase